MPVRQASPKDIAEMLILRQAGYSVLSISQKLGFSHRTVSRYLADNKVKKGGLKEEVIQAARDELAKAITSDETVREAAKLLIDNLAHVKLIREIMIEASEHLVATDLKGAALVLRAAASYSVAAKNTSDMLRHSFEIGKTTDDLEDMPELTIKVITDSQAAEMHKAGVVKDDEAEDDTVELMEED